MVQMGCMAVALTGLLGLHDAGDAVRHTTRVCSSNSFFPLFTQLFSLLWYSSTRFASTLIVLPILMVHHDDSRLPQLVGLVGLIVRLQGCIAIRVRQDFDDWLAADLTFWALHTYPFQSRGCCRASAAWTLEPLTSEDLPKWGLLSSSFEGPALHSNERQAIANALRAAENWCR